MKPLSALSLLASGLTASAQSFVSPNTNVETVVSEKFPGTSITYKEVNGICETTEGVKSYSGHVNLPREFIPDAGGAKGLPEGASGHFYFWYFEARNEPENAPTVIFLGGGPGYSPFDGSAVFPCYFNDDSNSTTLNEHSWNNNVNVLYVDQPLGSGFSYTSPLANGTLNTLVNKFTPALKDNVTKESVTDVDDLKKTSDVLIPATMHVTDPERSTNGTMAAAKTFWRFSQVWFNDFPEYKTKNDEVSFWGVSYAGFYTTMFTSHFLKQNDLIEEGKHEVKNATTFNMPTVGIINGMTDIEAMVLGNLDYARNNTYDHPIINETSYTELMGMLTAPADKGGCLALLETCRTAQAKLDVEMSGANPTVNKACGAAAQACFGLLANGFDEYTDYYPFDISVEKPGTFPEEFEAAFFNQRWVQEELGVPLNYTRGNDAMAEIFFGVTGDGVRFDISHLGYLLDRGLNIALLFGDRDYRCNWFSAENASLHIPFDGAETFADAGYADIVTNSSYNGGFVREHAGLSFSRIFQAGHSACGFAPETISKIFERATFRTDVATGKVKLAEEKDYKTKGKSDTRDVKNKLPEPVENICYVHQPRDTCTEEQIKALTEGTAETKDFVVISPKGTKGKRAGEGNDEEGGNDGDNGNGDGNGGNGGNDDREGSGIRLSASLTIAVTVFGFLALF